MLGRRFEERGAGWVGHKLLIVEDERDLVETCVRLLARRGHACLVAYTGQQGITLLDRQRPDLVITDLNLPDIDGLTVLRHAWAQSPPIPGILMTAYASLTTIDRARDAGAIHLPKPFSNVALIAAIDRTLASRSQWSQEDRT